MTIFNLHHSKKSSNRNVFFLNDIKRINERNIYMCYYAYIYVLYILIEKQILIMKSINEFILKKCMIYGIHYVLRK